MCVGMCGYVCGHVCGHVFGMCAGLCTGMFVGMCWHAWKPVCPQVYGHVDVYVCVSWFFSDLSWLTKFVNHGKIKWLCVHASLILCMYPISCDLPWFIKYVAGKLSDVCMCGRKGACKCVCVSVYIYIYIHTRVSVSVCCLCFWFIFLCSYVCVSFQLWLAVIYSVYGFWENWNWFIYVCIC